MAQTYAINLVNLIENFRCEDKCRAYLEELRWPDGVRCPRCEAMEKEHTVSRIHDRAQFDCDSCRYQFSVTAGTIFHDTKLPLWKWFLAVYMMVEAKKGVSANQLKRTLDVSYRTAWYLCHRIRAALQTPRALLAGIVEVDETIVGGKRPGSGMGSGSKMDENKAWVVGAVERDGQIRVKAVGDRSGKTLRQFIQDHVCPDAERIVTDEYAGYDWISNELNHVPRGTVKHSAQEWKRGEDHTNTIESAWGLFKRSLVGAYHKVSVKHLDKYLDEFEFRFNNRDNPFIFRDAMREMIRAETLEYSQLVA